MWVNGAPLTERFKQRSAYVAQEELFMPTLNAWETLEFQAVLRNRAGLTHAQLRERMHDVMAVMGLSRAKNTQVCTCSHWSLHLPLPTSWACSMHELCSAFVWLQYH